MPGGGGDAAPREPRERARRETRSRRRLRPARWTTFASSILDLCIGPGVQPVAVRALAVALPRTAPRPTSDVFCDERAHPHPHTHLDTRTHKAAAPGQPPAAHPSPSPSPKRRPRTMVCACRRVASLFRCAEREQRGEKCQLPRRVLAVTRALHPLPPSQPLCLALAFAQGCGVAHRASVTVRSRASGDGTARRERSAAWSVGGGAGVHGRDVGAGGQGEDVVGEGSRRRRRRREAVRLPSRPGAHSLNPMPPSSWACKPLSSSASSASISSVSWKEAWGREMHDVSSSTHLHGAGAAGVSACRRVGLRARQERVAEWCRRPAVGPGASRALGRDVEAGRGGGGGGGGVT